jgi:hypothetical protein
MQRETERDDIITKKEYENDITEDERRYLERNNLHNNMVYRKKA